MKKAIIINMLENIIFSTENNTIAQEDAINLKCNNCRRKQCENMMNDHGECYRTHFFR